MNRFFKPLLALGFALCVQRAMLAETPPQPLLFEVSTQNKVMHEYRGIKLSMKRDEVLTAMGKPESSNDTSDEFKLTGDDTMNDHYESGDVKAIQLAFLDAQNAPAWNQVVGDAEVKELANGAKSSRKTVDEEKYWVSIYQSKDKSMTRITMSRN